MVPPCELQPIKCTGNDRPKDHDIVRLRQSSDSGSKGTYKRSSPLMSVLNLYVLAFIYMCLILYFPDRSAAGVGARPRTYPHGAAQTAPGTCDIQKNDCDLFLVLIKACVRRVSTPMSACLHTIVLSMGISKLKMTRLNFKMTWALIHLPQPVWAPYLFSRMLFSPSRPNLSSLSCF